MKKFERIKYWIIPKGIENLLINFRDLFIDKIRYPFEKNIYKENIKFKNIHKGKRCFILATGPSINKLNLSVLKDEICFGVGQFYLHKDIDVVNPEYHIQAPQHPPFDTETAITIFKSYKKYYKNTTVIFLGDSNFKHSYKRVLLKHTNLKRKNNIFINFRNVIPLDEYNYLSNNVWDITKKPFPVCTVIFMALQVALYMGFKEIYLLGCDHDYLKDVNRVSNHHFYNEEKGISDVEHLTNYYDTEKWFFDYYKRWKCYRLVKEFARGKGVKIYNSTHGSMLDVFEFKYLEEIFNG